MVRVCPHRLGFGSTFITIFAKGSRTSCSPQHCRAADHSWSIHSCYYSSIDLRNNVPKRKEAIKPWTKAVNFTAKLFMEYPLLGSLSPDGTPYIFSIQAQEGFGPNLRKLSTVSLSLLTSLFALCMIKITCYPHSLLHRDITKLTF